MKLKVSLLLLSLSALLVWWAVVAIPDSKLHVYFCDVGQGDGALVIQGSVQLVIDTGPDDKILNCLSRYMPFYDHTIEGVIITHPQQDHMGGLSYIAESYSVIHIFIPPANNDIRVYSKLMDLYRQNKVQVSNLYTGDKLTFGKVEFQSVWPSMVFTKANTADLAAKVLGVKTDGTDLNSFSIVGILSYGQTDILFTGDADSSIDLAEIATGLLRPVEILKVPHHGSKTGMSDEWLELVKPKTAIISVGKNNRYGHPAQ
ncbi:MBL fold metallo-hydrolase, partial [Candidatus Woesebacteria bacterium]|nr:MBL fold metallo-hydrolase [Candidatus Woesebacteria bacterium]